VTLANQKTEGVPLRGVKEFLKDAPIVNDASNDKVAKGAKNVLLGKNIPGERKTFGGGRPLGRESKEKDLTKTLLRRCVRESPKRMRTGNLCQ